MIYSSYSMFVKDLNEMLSQSREPHKSHKMTAEQQRRWFNCALQFFGVTMDAVIQNQKQKTK